MWPKSSPLFTTCTVTLAWLKLWNEDSVHHALCVINCCIACLPPPTPTPSKTKAGNTGAKQGRACCMNGDKKQLHHEKRCCCFHSALWALSLSLSDCIPPSFTRCLSLSLTLYDLSFLAPFICCCLSSSLFLVPFPYPPTFSSSSPLPAVCSPTVFPAARRLLWRSSRKGLVLPSSWAFKSCDLSLIGHILHVSFVYGLILFLPHNDLHWWILPSVIDLNCGWEVLPHHKK